jgi:hypothetical protein
LFLKRRGTPLAAEAVRLSADDLRHGRAARDEYPAHRILNHVIFALGQDTVRLPGSEFSKCAAKEKIEDDQEDQDKDNSIHSGTKRVTPQSYGDGDATVNILAGGFC